MRDRKKARIEAKVFQIRVWYFIIIVYFCTPRSGYSEARLSRLLWEQEIAGSNPATPTTKMKEARSIYCGLFLWCEVRKLAFGLCK